MSGCGKTGGSFCKLYTPVPYNDKAIDAMSDPAAAAARTNEELYNGCPKK